jgi:hypothetical protein
MKEWKERPGNTFYILVHADDFAIGHSMFKKDPDAVKASIRQRCRAFHNLRVPIIFTNLAMDDPPLPEYLRSLDIPMTQIPNANSPNLEEQLEFLKRHLSRFPRRHRYIFAGGWRDACLRRTINQVAYRKRRLSVTEAGLPGFADAEFRMPGRPDRKIAVGVDWENVF